MKKKPCIFLLPLKNDGEVLSGKIDERIEEKNEKKNRYMVLIETFQIKRTKYETSKAFFSNGLRLDKI